MENNPSAAAQQSPVELSLDALVEVLQRVPLGPRLTSCAAVNSAWHTAALKATRAIQLQGSINKQRVQCLLLWLKKSRAVISSIHLEAGTLARYGGFQLSLSGLADALGSPAALEAMSISNAALTGLALGDPLTALASFPALRALYLQQVINQPPHADIDKARQSPLRLPDSVLSGLTQLTALHLGPGPTVSNSSLQHLSCLKGLQQLHLAWPGQQLAAEPLQQLPQLAHLTYLSIAGAGFAVSSEGTPWIQKLTGLQHLAITACRGFDPALLTVLTALQHFELCDTRVQGYTTGISTLLACLPQLRCLTQLKIQYSLTTPLTSAEAYSGLTAASQLQHSTLQDVVIRRGTWQVIFPAERQLQQLTAVSIATGGPLQPVLQQHDLDRLVECCPNLQSFDVGRALHPYADITSLTRLTALRQLSVSNVTGTSMRSEVLSHLTGLSMLELCAPSNLTADGLMYLVPLRQLQKLVVASHCADWSLGLGSDRLEFLNKVGHGAAC